MKIIISLVCILVLSLTAFTPKASACSCAAEWNIENDFVEPGSIIFSGKITNIKEQQMTFFVTFEVSQSWKGIPNNISEINVMTSQSSASCGYYFTPGESYLVVAYGKWNETPGVSSCSSTVLLSSASEEISFLNKNPINLPFQPIKPPLQQIKLGKNILDIECKTGLELVTKNNGSPACVKQSTIQKLIERGWIANSKTDGPSSRHCSLVPEVGPCKAAFTKYYFDPDTKSCQSFIWGGCDGTVPFDTLELCKSLCS